VTTVDSSPTTPAHWLVAKAGIHLQGKTNSKLA